MTTPTPTELADSLDQAAHKADEATVSLVDIDVRMVRRIAALLRSIPIPTPGGPAESETLWERMVLASSASPSRRLSRMDADGNSEIEMLKAEFARILAEVEREATRRAMELPADVLAAVERNRSLPRGAGPCGCDECTMAAFIRRLAPVPTGGPDVTPKPAPAGGDER